MRVLKWVGLAVAIIGALLVVVLAVLWPPAPLTSPQEDMVLSGVTIVNPGIGRRVDQRVTIHGSLIESIAGDNPGAPESADTRRFSRAYVLPGLIDMHVHHMPAAAVADTRMFELMYLAHGVTTVRDTGNFDNSIFKTRAQILAGDLAGPRIFACGPIIDGEPPIWPGSKVARTAAEAERIVDRLAAAGVHCIKAYQNLSPDALRGLRNAATRHHLPLLGHVPVTVRFEDAHLDDVQHLTGVAVVPGAVPSADPAAAIMANLRAFEIIDDARISFVVRTSVQQNLVHTPTMVVIDQLARLGSEYPAMSQDPEVQMLPRYYPDLLWNPRSPFSVDPRRSAPMPDFAKVRANVRKVVRALHEAGITLHVGTDTSNPFVVPGASLQTELRNFVGSGFTPEQAWAAATRENGASLAEPGLGTIAEGAPADLLVFREDPTRDLAALSTLEAVVADGRFYSTATLDHAIARYRDKFHGLLYDRISALIFRYLMASQAPARRVASRR
jgi:amidohydrolase family protein